MQTKRWSNEDLKAEFTNCNFLGDIISELESKFLLSGEVICEIRVNGMFLSESDEEKFANSNIDEISSLEVKSRDPKDLISESLESTLEWVPRVKIYSLETSQLFRDGRIKEGQKALTEVIDGCQWLTDALGLLKNVIISRSTDKEISKKWSEVEEAFGQSVKDVLDAHEQNDIVLLADVMEYDLTNSLDKWLELLSTAS